MEYAYDTVFSLIINLWNMLMKQFLVWSVSVKYVNEAVSSLVVNLWNMSMTEFLLWLLSMYNTKNYNFHLLRMRTLTKKLHCAPLFEASVT